MPKPKLHQWHQSGATIGQAPLWNGTEWAAGTVVRSVVAGSGVTVDDTDPANPVVAASGGGGGIESIVAGDGASVDDTDPLNPIIAAALNAGTNVTLTVELDGSITIAASGGGGGGGLAPAYLGKNAVGASWVTITTNGVFKKITTTDAAVLLGIEAYLRQATDSVSAIGAALYSDVSGTPGRLLAFGGQSNTSEAFILNKVGTETGASGVGRWLAMSVPYQLAAATSYWIGVSGADTANQIDLAYDTSGSDRTVTVGQSWLSDWGRYTVATTTRDHSIRANVLT